MGKKNKTPEEGTKYTMQQVYGYLLQKGVPRSMIDDIRITLANDAIQEQSDMKYDRIYSAIALMLHRTYHFGAERIMRGMREFDRLCGAVCDENYGWTEMMEELDRETGIVIRTGSDDRLVCEYIGRNLERAKDIYEAQEEARKKDA